MIGGRKSSGALTLQAVTNHRCEVSDDDDERHTDLDSKQDFHAHLLGSVSGVHSSERTPAAQSVFRESAQRTSGGGGEPHTAFLTKI